MAAEAQLSEILGSPELFYQEDDGKKKKPG
jgi:hypothetical protein